MCRAWLRALPAAPPAEPAEPHPAQLSRCSAWVERCVPRTQMPGIHVASQSAAQLCYQPDAVICQRGASGRTAIAWPCLQHAAGSQDAVRWTTCCSRHSSGKRTSGRAGGGLLRQRVGGCARDRTSRRQASRAKAGRLFTAATLSPCGQSTHAGLIWRREAMTGAAEVAHPKHSLLLPLAQHSNNPCSWYAR